MKLSGCIFVLLLVVLLVIALLAGSSDARKKKANKRMKAGVCKFDRKGEESPCNATTNTKEVTLKLKKGDPTSCQPTKVITKPCNDNSVTKKKKVKGCKYERKGAEWTECDATTNEKTKVMKLKPGANPECPETHTKTRSCGGGNKRKGGARRSRKDA